MEHRFYSFELHLLLPIFNMVLKMYPHIDHNFTHGYSYVRFDENLSDDEIYNVCKLVMESEVPFNICCLTRDTPNKLYNFTYSFHGKNLINNESMCFNNDFIMNDEEENHLKQFELLEKV